MIQKYGKHPDAPAVAVRIDHLESVVRRIDADKQQIVAPLTRLFADPLVCDVWMIETKGEHAYRYYLKDDPGFRATRMEPISYIAGFDLVEKKAGVDAGKLAFNGPAPQVGLAKEVRPLLKALDGTNWEQTFFRIVRAIDESKQIDPLLKVNLLRQTLEIGSRGSTVFEQAFGKHLEKLTEQNVNPFANWLDPKDQDARGQRQRAQAALQGFPDVAAAGKEAAAALAKLRQPPGKVRRWIGWLRRGSSGKWRCEPAALGDRSGELFVVVSQGIGEGITFERVGAVKDGIASLEILAGSGRTEGSPLFVVSP